MITLNLDRPEAIAIPIARPAEAEETVLDHEELERYIQLAKDIGMEQDGAILEERLRRFLKDENIHCYDADQVVPFLDKKLGDDWVWRGLRQVDADHLNGWSLRGVEGVRRRVIFGEKRYRGAVPYPVLLTVKTVMDQFPEAHFYVSDSRTGDGDPFLAIANQNTKEFIIERWDEPNYRER